MARKMFVVRCSVAAVIAAAVVLAAMGCAGSSDGSDVLATEPADAPAAGAESSDDPQAPATPEAAADSEAGAGSEAATEDAAGSGDSVGAEPSAEPDGDVSAAPSDDSPSETSGPIASTPREDVPSALRDPFGSDHPAPLVDLDEITGVVPPDAIPALEDPAFEPAGEVEWLAAVEPVLALEINGDARAYPLRIMTWHELVNGTVGGVPVTVSYCPLCNSAVAYDRRVGERILDFGTSGALLNSSLVMYDRQTESLWSHYTGQAVAGHLAGAELDLIPVQTVSFETFLESHPDGGVLGLDTGHSRQYGRNPYESYDSNNRPFLFRGSLDERLDPITRVVALRDGDQGAVITYDVLAERRVVRFSFAGRDLVALYALGTASALDSADIAAGRDVGATGVFVGSLAGRPLELSANAAGGFTDTATGVVYDVLGRPLQPAGGEALEPVEHLDTFWFAAAAFYPGAEIITAP